jgi:hypothetical protein
MEGRLVDLLRFETRLETEWRERALQALHGLLQFDVRTAAAVAGLTILDESLP